MARDTTGEKLICSNRKAFHNYHIDERYEAGLVLQGSEVKSLREGRANLADSYAGIQGEEIFLYNCHISPYSHGNIMNHDPLRTRKLLLHRNEIDNLTAKANIKGYTLIPLKIYFKDSFVKIEIGLAKGKRLFEKRESIKEREAKREIERAMKTN